MSTYLLLDIVFIGIALLINRQLSHGWLLPTVRLVVLLVLTTIMFDWYLTRLPIVQYSPAKHFPLLLGSIPFEDFGYSIAAAIVIPPVFEYLKKHHGSSAED